MALTRKFLTALGIEPEKVDEIIDAHAETVTALKEERDNAKADAERLAEVEAERDNLKKQVADLKGKGGDALQEKYDKLKSEFEQYKKDVVEANAKREKIQAYRELLREAGVSEKRIDSIIRISGDAIEQLELDDEKKVKDPEKHIEGIKKEFEDFIVKEKTVGASTKTPPANNGGGTMTKEDIMKIKDASERQKAIAENHELFGF